MSEVEEKRMSLLEHFDELRRRLYRVLISFVIVSVILFIPLNLFSSEENILGNSSTSGNPIDQAIVYVINFLNRMSGQGYDSLTTRFIKFARDYMLPSDAVLISGGPTAAMIYIIKTTMILSLLLISPHIAYEILAFIWPALYRHEKEILRKYIAISAIYILSGLLVGFFIVARSVIRAGYFWSISIGATYYVNISNFIDDILTSMLGTLIVFLVPLGMIIATELGFLNPYSEFFRNRKILYTVAWILLVFFLPDVTAIILFIIFIIVYEPSFAYMRRIYRRKSLGEALPR